MQDPATPPPVPPPVAEDILRPVAHLELKAVALMVFTLALIVGSALSLWDAANDTRKRLTNGRALASVDFDAFQKRAEKYGKQVAQRFAAPAPAPAPKRGISAGGVLALILGAAAALGVLYAAWQTLRADDELWVADDPLRAPDA